MVYMVGDVFQLSSRMTVFLYRRTEIVGVLKLSMKALAVNHQYRSVGKTNIACTTSGRIELSAFADELQARDEGKDVGTPAGSGEQEDVCGKAGSAILLADRIRGITYCTQNFVFVAKD